MVSTIFYTYNSALCIGPVNRPEFEAIPISQYFSNNIHTELDDLWVFTKPVNVSVNDEKNKAGFISQQKQLLGVDQIHPVHRLDSATSGLLLAAKHSEANRVFSRAFQNQEVEKVYIAIVRTKSGGQAKKKQGWIVGDMKPSRDGSWKLLRSQDNPARTYFVSESLGDRYRLALLYPITGKTHQLRVAMKANATPIVGDERYGGEQAERLYLHACYLGFSYQGSPHQYVLIPEMKGLFSKLEQKQLVARVEQFLNSVKGRKRG